MNYKIGITSYNDWDLLWETKVGLQDKKLTLLYAVYGKTEIESKSNAESLIASLELKHTNKNT